MIITKTQVTKIELTGLDRLDPVQVIAEDLGLGRGKITVSCFGNSWTNFWGGMGAQKIIEFVATCHVDYLAEKLSTLSKYETNWDQVNDEVSQKDEYGLLFGYIDETTAYQYADELGAQYGEGGDWRHNLPSRVTSEYAYLCRVIEAVIGAFKDIGEES